MLSGVSYLLLVWGLSLFVFDCVLLVVVLLFVDSWFDPSCWRLAVLLLVVVFYVLLVVRCELRVVYLFSGIAVSVLYGACWLLLIVVF